MLLALIWTQNSFLINMKRMYLLDHRLKRYAITVQYLENVLHVLLPIRLSVFGEEFILIMEKFQKSLANIEQKPIGQRYGRI